MKVTAIMNSRIFMGPFVKWALVTMMIFGYVSTDTPANCTYEDIRGTWILSVTRTFGDNNINCTTDTKYVDSVKITLNFPDVAVDENGNLGFWTLIYNQGFEVVIGGRKFFAFSMYQQQGDVVQNLCHQTFPGWVHDVNERNWNCFVGEKVDAQSSGKTYRRIHKTFDMPFRYSKSLISAINTQTTLWTAARYHKFEKMKLSEVTRMAGGTGSSMSYPKCATITKEHMEASTSLPKEFDWRNINGVNFVSPIRDQGSCGSCYAFASMALYEARLRVISNNTVQKVFSTQDVVSCSQYAQGCEGGFPYLIAGKYGQDFGLIEENCFPYEAQDMPCQKSTCLRYYTLDYYYIGGYYGACNEPLMRMELVKNGPIAVSFEVYNDFMSYKGGIYHHTGLEDKFNPWEITNHVVLVVGYGEEAGVPFWIVKNSWGPEWGEDGFFRIRRGTDECSIESIAVGIQPIM